ncbi:hypothetical protein NL108_015400 [Boleophthalmus pectinirostris]|nr:hypothetical protein NL108_015400 [Boleophthalmus pectinirostris]
MTSSNVLSAGRMELENSRWLAEAEKIVAQNLLSIYFKLHIFCQVLVFLIKNRSITLFVCQCLTQLSSPFLRTCGASKLKSTWCRGPRRSAICSPDSEKCGSTAPHLLPSLDKEEV